MPQILTCSLGFLKQLPSNIGTYDNVKGEICPKLKHNVGLSFDVEHLA